MINYIRLLFSNFGKYKMECIICMWGRCWMQVGCLRIWGIWILWLLRNSWRRKPAHICIGYQVLISISKYLKVMSTKNLRFSFVMATDGHLDLIVSKKTENQITCSMLIWCPHQHGKKGQLYTLTTSRMK